MRGLRLGALLWLCVAGCYRAAGGPAPEPPGSLEGLTLPLLPSPHLRLVVGGTLEKRPVPVVLDVTRPLSVVSSECWPQRQEPPVVGVARVPELAGGERQWSLVRLKGLRVGTVALGPRGVGLTDERTCAVTLGADVLAPYAFTVDPWRREVSFTKSRPRAEYVAELAAPGAEAAEETHLLELSRDPQGDWPLVVARVKQGPRVLTGPFLLGTREPFSRLAVGPAESQGFQPVETAGGLPPRAFGVDGVALASEVEVGPLALEAGVGWRNPSTLGRLGADVWGRFRATVDVQGDTLVLRRPRVEASGTRQRCARGGTEPREEACFGLHVRRTQEGREAVTGAVFRDLPEGGQVHLQPLGEGGAPLSLDCKVGFSFSPTSRGVSTQHLVPWPKLAEAMPECHEALKTARGYALELFEEGALAQCPNACIFVFQPSTRRTLCECQPSPLGDAMAVPRRSNLPQLPTPREREQEPEDPR